MTQRHKNDNKEMDKVFPKAIITKLTSIVIIASGKILILLGECLIRHGELGYERAEIEENKIKDLTLVEEKNDNLGEDK